jgi:tetrapyrrole methylase family protein/MazG family protein
MTDSPAHESSPGSPVSGTPPDPVRLGPMFRELCDVVAKLRSAAGCPWDREQTLASIKPYTLEETYELLDAIDSGDDAAIVEELGDVLLQVLLDSQIAADEGRFNLVDVVDGITRKMIRRHPHVFGDTAVDSASEVTQQWDRIKQEEKQRDSIFDGLPVALPALARAARLAKKAARVGYDFPARAMLFDKLREELAELGDELFPGGEIPNVPATVDAPVEPDAEPFDPVRQQRIEAELGDVLFVLANIARRWHINPEEALRASNAKFQRRVQYIEQHLKEHGRDIRSATLVEMEQFYQEGKQRERETL